MNPTDDAPFRRTSKERWASLRLLIHRIDRLVQAAALLERRAGPGMAVRSHTIDLAAQFEGELEQLELKVGTEVRRLTVEGLEQDLKARKRRDAVQQQPKKRKRIA